MAEARIHLLLDTVFRAQFQLDEQKHYCLASLETLVKLLPQCKSNKGGRRKGLRVFKALGLQNSFRKLQASLVLPSERREQDQAVQHEAFSPKKLVSRDEGQVSGIPDKDKLEHSFGRKTASTGEDPASGVPEHRSVGQAVVPREHASPRKTQGSRDREFEGKAVLIEDLAEKSSEGVPTQALESRSRMSEPRRSSKASSARSSSPLVVQQLAEPSSRISFPFEPAEGISTGQVVSPLTREGRVQDGQKAPEGELFSVRKLSSRRKSQASGSPQKAFQQLAEGRSESSVPETHEPVQQSLEPQHFSESKVLSPSTRKSQAEAVQQEAFSPRELVSRPEGQVTWSPDAVPETYRQSFERKCTPARQDPASGKPEPGQKFFAGEAASRLHFEGEVVTREGQGQAIQHAQCEAFSPKELASSRKSRVFGVPNKVAGPFQHTSGGRSPSTMQETSEAVQNFFVGESALSFDILSLSRSKDQSEAVHSEDEPIPPKQLTSTRKKQVPRIPENAPGAIQHFTKGQFSRQDPVMTEAVQQTSIGKPASRKKRPASGLPEPVASSKRQASLNLVHGEAGAWEGLQTVGSYRSEGITSEASRPVESRGQVSEPGMSSKSNLVASMRSFLPLVVQRAALPIASGKKGVRVKALEAAEAAKRLEEKRLEERKRKLESLNFLEQKIRLDQQKQKKLEEGERKKDEQRKKKEVELKAKKRKKEEVEKEREEKRRKVEDAMQMKKEQEEKLRAELEEKERRKKAIEEAERERKALEEEIKRQKRLEKEREIERRRKADEDAKAAWLATKKAERKRREETFQRMKVLEREQRSHGAVVIGTSELPVRETSLNLSKQSLGLEKEQRSHVAGVFCHSELLTKGTSLNLAKKSLGNDGAGEKFAGTPALRIRSCGSSRMLLVVPISDSEDSDGDEPTYEISPYKSSSEDEGDEKEQKKAKVVPRWARKENLMRHLMRQVNIDPDAIFSGAKSCSLNEVFGTTGNKKRRDFSQRSGSGDWLSDMVTWKEELEYKRTMGFLQHRAG